MKKSNKESTPGFFLQRAFFIALLRNKTGRLCWRPVSLWWCHYISQNLFVKGGDDVSGSVNYCWRQELTIWTDLFLSTFARVELLTTLTESRNNGRWMRDQSKGRNIMSEQWPIDLPVVHVRVARPTDRLEEVVAFYRDGIGLPVIAG